MTDKKISVEEVAKALGMKPAEVTEVLRDADGVLAQTCDGNWTLIRDGGTFEFLGQDLGERAGPDAEPEKAVSKGRNRA